MTSKERKVLARIHWFLEEVNWWIDELADRTALLCQQAADWVRESVSLQDRLDQGQVRDWSGHRAAYCTIGGKSWLVAGCGEGDFGV